MGFISTAKALFGKGKKKDEKDSFKRNPVRRSVHFRNPPCSVHEYSKGSRLSYPGTGEDSDYPEDTITQMVRMRRSMRDTRRKESSQDSQHPSRGTPTPNRRHSTFHARALETIGDDESIYIALEKMKKREKEKKKMEEEKSQTIEELNRKNAELTLKNDALKIQVQMQMLMLENQKMKAQLAQRAPLHSSTPRASPSALFPSPPLSDIGSDYSTQSTARVGESLSTPTDAPSATEGPADSISANTQ